MSNAMSEENKNIFLIEKSSMKMIIGIIICLVISIILLISSSSRLKGKIDSYSRQIETLKEENKDLRQDCELE